MNKELNQVCASMNEETRTLSIYVYGTIVPEGWRWYDDEVSATSFNKELEKCDCDKINVYINSGGGSLFEALAIYATLRRRKEIVTTYVDGIAASAASLIALAGKKVVMYKHSIMMIHNALTSAKGNMHELRKIADDLEKINQSIVEIYMLKFNDSEENLKSLLNEETYLSATQCLAYGLVDEVLNDANEFSVQNSILSDIVFASKKEETPPKKVTNRLFRK